tara:strand:- start:451 stop:1065 length:615 start_codon:yes stop_codon:yes gene_type:complete
MKFKESTHLCPDSRAHMKTEELIKNNVKDQFNLLKRASYTHYIVDSVFDDYTCDKIINSESDSPWLIDLLYQHMNELNDIAGWKYNITGHEEPQLQKYKVNNTYPWHRDGYGDHRSIWNEESIANDKLYKIGTTRKLTMTILLNDGKDFEGGNYEVFLPRNQKIPFRNKGSIVLMPAFIAHTVEPVTSGERHSLTTFFLGPPFV